LNVVAVAEVAEVVYLALGSNLGDRAAYLTKGRAAIAALPSTRIIAESEVEETAPIGPKKQARYLNQMLAVETSLEPEDLLEAVNEIERANGRTRTKRWSARTLDIDIVRFGDRRISTPELTVPHPELERRDFWQRGLAQVEST
jgi:2-amino-4-hydroxy-6-hydroxymethyldihydropteridine diphosphokinase